MPIGVYSRTEWHRLVCAENLRNAKRGVYTRTTEMRRSISKATCKQWVEGKHKHHGRYMRKLWVSKQGENLRRKVSEGVSRRLRKAWKDPAFREKTIKALRSGNKISKPQRLMFRMVRLFFADAKLEYFVKTPETSFHVDIVVPDKRIAIEVDGRYWHSSVETKQLDHEKNFQLWNYAWKLYRIEAEKVKIYGMELLAEILADDRGVETSRSTKYACW